MKKVLVTGGSGLVGKYVVNEFVAHQYDVGVLDIVAPGNAVRFHRADILSLADVEKAVRGYDAVVHMAGIPQPIHHPGESVFFVNVNGTFNILEAAARAGVRKVVFTSSESTLGFAFMTNRIWPEYVPIDENHRLRPQDPYGLSKLIGEEICRAYSARYSIHTVCLRAPWIWVPEEKEIAVYRELIAEQDKWWKNLWAYVHVFDAAQAHRLAVEKDLVSPHEVFFVAAKENWTGIDSLILLRRHFPEISRIASDFVGPASIISFRKAAQVLGYEPHFSRSDILST